MKYEVNELQAAWIDFLSRYDWEWFCTMTFREAIHPEAAHKAYLYWMRKLNEELLGLRWRRKSSEQVRWVRAMEWQKRGVLHYHALVAGVTYENRDYWAKQWDKIAGFARIDPFVSDGLYGYITKYVVKGGQIDVSDNVEFSHSLRPFAPWFGAVQPKRIPSRH